MAYELDITKQAVGAHLGGKRGAVIKCPECDKSGCAIDSRHLVSGKLLTVAHRLSLDEHCTLRWNDVCVEKPKKGKGAERGKAKHGSKEAAA